VSNNHTTAELPRFVKTAVVRRMLGNISRDTLRQLIDDGLIPPLVEFNSRLKLFEFAPLLAAVRQRGRQAAR